MTKKGSGTSKRLDWRSQLTSFLLGTASGMATNLVSGATAYRAIAASVILVALLTASTRLSSLPPRAPIVRYAIWLMMALSFVAAVAAVAGPPALAPYMIFGAVASTGAAVMIPTQTIDRLRMLAEAAVVGVGVAVISIGVTMLNHHLFQAAQAGFLGVMVVVVGRALLKRVDLHEMNGIGVATLIISTAVITLIDHGTVGLIPQTIILVVLIVGAVLFLGGGNAMRASVATGAGTMVVVIGAVQASNGHYLGGMAAGIAGVALVGMVVAHLANGDSANHVKHWFASLAKEPNAEAGEKTGRRSSHRPSSVHEHADDDQRCHERS